MNTDQAPTPKPLHHCSACLLAVLVLGEQVIKACACVAPIVGNMSATVKGRGDAGVR